MNSGNDERRSYEKKNLNLLKPKTYNMYHQL